MSIQKQIEYLKKVKDKTISEEELRDYLTMIVEDNFVNLPTIAKLVFEDDKDNEGTYKHNIISINDINIKNFIKEYKTNDFVSILNTLGHETRHHWQENCGMKEYITRNKDRYYERLNKWVEREGADFVYLETAKAIRDFIVFDSKKTLKLLDKLPHLNKWFQSLDKTKIFQLEKDLEKSHYIQQLNEQDARYGSIIWASLLFNEYERYCNSNGEYELLSFVQTLRSLQEQNIRSYAKNFENYAEYKKFKQAFADVNIEIIREFNSILMNEDLDKYEIAVYSGLLDMYLNEFVERLTPEQAEVIFIHHISNLFKTSRTKEENRLSKLFLENIVKSSLEENKKREFATVVFFKYMENLENYKFSKNDLVLKYFFVNDLISLDAYFELINILVDKNREDEAIELLKVSEILKKDIFKTDADIFLEESLKIYWDLIILKAEKVYMAKSIKQEKEDFAIKLKEFKVELENYINWYNENDGKEFSDIQMMVYDKINFNDESYNSIIKKLNLSEYMQKDQTNSKNNDFKVFTKALITEIPEEEKETI